MPSLFSSRRRGSSANPPVDRSSSSAATLAAGQAFMARPASTANLSSAAAAAALRSQTTSPELPGNVQTKRMQRRTSTSSAGSGSVIGSGTRGGVGRGGLQRSNSGGSMTERTFRSPSPGWQTEVVEADRDAPPVPTIPNGHKRSASLEPPERITSPTPGAGKRGSSVDRASVLVQGKSRPAKRLSNVNEEVGAGSGEAPASPSRNFSRPMSKDGGNGGAKNKVTHGQGSWFTQPAGDANAGTSGRPRTSDGTMPASPPGIHVPLTNPKSKKRISATPGSHLSQANRNSIATSETSSESDSFMVFDPNTRSFITKRRNVVEEPDSPVQRQSEQVYDKNTRSFITRAQSEDERDVPAARPLQTVTSKKAKPSMAALDTSLQPPPKNPARYSPSPESPSSPRAMGFLHKQPSVVREDREAEEQAEASQPKAKQPAPRSQRSTTMPAKAYAAAETTSHQRSSSLAVPRGESAGRGRNTSISPQRSTRFSPSPVMDTTRHDPPGRDVSPVKSALKHSPSSSVRGSSPYATQLATRTLNAPSESDAGSDVGSQDGAPKRKKSVRVSFDEQAREIAPTAPVPAAAVEDEPSDDDAVMKPRPALPSFGSVRRQGGMSPEPAEKVTEMAPDREGASSDAALGGILAGSLRGEGKKVERENSPQEPLPPEVTSREMADYASDSSSEANVPAPMATGEEAGGPATRDFAQATEDVDEGGSKVPAIALQPPTPGLEEDVKRELQEPDEEGEEETKRKNRLSGVLSMPGGWGDDEEEEAPSSQAPVPEPAVEVQRRSSVEDSAATQTVTPIEPETVEQTRSHELSDIYEDSDDSAEFSDAAEDLSDLEDGGFASLDAIVESPMVTSTPLEKKTGLQEVDEADESPTARKTDERGAGDWGAATAYWSNLSKQQKEQIERDHLSEDEEPKPAPAKAKKKQPVAGPAPLKPALKQTSQQPAQSGSMRKSMRAQSGPTPAPADEGGVHMRRSMRSGGSGGGGMMSTMRDGPRQRPQSEVYPEQKSTLQKRPMSSSGIPASASGTAMRSSMRPGSSESSMRQMPQESSYPPLPDKRASQPNLAQQKTSEPPTVSKRLQKELAKADDSDSESSFRKQRRRNRGGSVSTMDSRGAYSMRKSMRGGPPEPAAGPAAPPPRPVSPEVPRGSRWSMRSLSPFGRKKEPARASMDSGPRTTLRSNQPPAGRSTSASASARGRPSTSSVGANSRFKSRFTADSDDEDDARPAKTFRSRFADSDDEDDGPAELTPVRGIPKRSGQEDGDSTDLEEEEESDPRKRSRQRQKQAIPMVPDPGDVEKAMAAARKNLGMEQARGGEQETSQGNALSKGSLRQKNEPPPASPQPPKASPAPQPQTQEAGKKEKKRGFMGSILRRNRNSQTVVPQTTAAAAAAAAPSSPASPASPAPESPTANKLRRSSYQNQTTPPSRPKRGDSDLSTATAPEMHTPSNRDSTNWPLAPPVPKIPEQLSSEGSPSSFTRATSKDEPAPRPSTSDGVSTSRGNGNEVKLARTMRPSMGGRAASEQVSSRSGGAAGGHVSFVAGDEGTEPGEGAGKRGEVYSRRTGKKKRFGVLRRAFGLDD